MTRTDFANWDNDIAATNPQLRPADLPTNRPAEQAASGEATNRRSPLLRFLSGVVSIVEWPFEFILNDVLGFEIGERRGHGQPVCEICGVDVHDVDELCPLQRIGDCSTCGATVDLDRWGNCIPAGDRWRLHSVSNRRSALRSGRDSNLEFKTEEVIAGT